MRIELHLNTKNSLDILRIYASKMLAATIEIIAMNCEFTISVTEFTLQSGDERDIFDKLNADINVRNLPTAIRLQKFPQYR